MRRSENRPDKSGSFLSVIGWAANSAGTVILRNPLSVGGGTAFLVALFFVSANALWYQPHAHTGVFFVTRDMPYEAPGSGHTHSVMVPQPAPERFRTASGESDTSPPPAEQTPASSDPIVMQVQSILGDLEFYDGERDGLFGPQTRAAIEEYQRVVGIDVSGTIDDELLAQLGSRHSPVPSLPTPEAKPEQPTPAATEAESPPIPVVEKPKAKDRSGGDANVVRVQAGLKAFGNDHIEIDGMIGDQTRAAIREFQSLFGLTVNGEPDRELVAKMREIGLIR